MYGELSKYLKFTSTADILPAVGHSTKGVVLNEASDGSEQ